MLSLIPSFLSFFFFLNDTATPEIYPLPLPDALPISKELGMSPPQLEALPGEQELPASVLEMLGRRARGDAAGAHFREQGAPAAVVDRAAVERSEEHTSELQSLAYLVCRLLLEKKKK